jgi:hypothetical protein
LYTPRPQADGDVELNDRRRRPIRDRAEPP